MTPWTVAHQAPLSMGFSRQEYWSGFHSLLQGIFPTQEWNPGLAHCRQILYSLSQPPGKPKALLSRSHSFLHMRNMWRKLVLKPLGFSILGSAVGPGFVFCCCCCLFCLSAPECTVRVENISYVTGHLPTSMSMCPLVLAFFPDTSAPVTSAILRPLAWRLTLCPDFHKPGSSCH